MKDGELIIKGRKGDKNSYIRVHLSFDIPEEKMRMLIEELSNGVEKWENRIILIGQGVSPAHKTKQQ